MLKQGERRKIARVAEQAAAEARRRQAHRDRQQNVDTDTALDLKADQTALDALDLRVDAEEALTITFDGRLDTAEANITTLGAADTALDGRLDTVEAALPAKLAWASVPASAASVGTAGQIAYESGFVYVCVATDTWQRVALATWP